MEHSVGWWFEQGGPWLWRAMSAVAIFMGFWLVSLLPIRLMAPASSLHGGRNDVLLMLAQVFRVALIAFGLLLALQKLGVDIAGVAAGLGLTGLALGLAFKDVLGNLISGALILFYRPFQRGEHIKVNDLEGRVREVNLRYTVLDGDGCRVLIPNATLFTNSIRVQEKNSDAPAEE